MNINKIREVINKNDSYYRKGYDVFSKNLLTKNLNKFINVGLNRSKNKTKSKADTFRRLVVFSEDLAERIQKLSDELVQEKAEVYFPQSEASQKVYIVETGGDKHAVVEPFTGNADWNKALRQLKRELMESGAYNESNFR